MSEKGGSAIVIATGCSPDMGALNERCPTALMPLVDRPFVQHVVECLVERGIARFDFVLSHLPEMIERALGDGSRWGATFTYHLVRDPDRPYERLKTIGMDGIQRIVLAQADRLVDLAACPDGLGRESSPPRVLVWRDQPDAPPRRWTGWCWTEPQMLVGIDADLTEIEFGDRLVEAANQRGIVAETSRPLDSKSYSGLLDANLRALSKEFRGLYLTGQEAQEGVRLSRNVSIHPTARIVPPVFIGANCRVNDGARIGPRAVIGQGCVLDRRSQVEGSLVFGGSYVGEALEVRDSIVDRNCLVNAPAGVALPIVDDFILGSMSDRALSRAVASAFGRVCALALLVGFSPLILLTFLWLALARQGKAVRSKAVLRLPANSERRLWREFLQKRFDCQERGVFRGTALQHFLLRFLPGLPHVVRGELSMVGALPRSREEAEALPDGWRALYLRSKAGLVTPAYVEHGPCCTEDETYTAEAYYSVHAGPKCDLKLFSLYLLRIPSSLWPFRSPRRAAS